MDFMLFATVSRFLLNEFYNIFIIIIDDSNKCKIKAYISYEIYANLV